MAAIFFAGFLWVASRIARGALDKTLLMSDRIEAAAASMMLLAVSIPIAGLAATGTVSSPIRTGMLATFLTVGVMGLVSRACKVREWFDRYRRLVSEGVEVPRRGFSWRLLAAWAISATLLLALGTITTTARNNAVQLAVIVPGAFAALGTLPILALTARFVRRVNTYFEQHKTIGLSDDNTTSDEAEPSQIPR